MASEWGSRLCRVSSVLFNRDRAAQDPGVGVTLYLTSSYRYQVMLRCWEADPAARPTFSALVLEVKQVVASLLGDHYVQLTAAYVNIGPGAVDDRSVFPEQVQSSPQHHRSTSRPRPLSEPPLPT